LTEVCLLNFLRLALGYKTVSCCVSSKGGAKLVLMALRLFHRNISHENGNEHINPKKTGSSAHSEAAG
jgi:hypothetical protein